MLKDILMENNMSIYEASRRSGIPYSTLNDLVNGKKEIEHCSVRLLKTLADLFRMDMDRLYHECRHYTLNEFENFKSHICHELKRKGKVDYLIDLLSSDLVVEYWERGNRVESFYLLGMTDYLSGLCGVPLCDRYEAYRGMKLAEPVYPLSAAVSQEAKKYCLEHAIPEFLQYGIVEGEVFDVR